MPKNLPYYYQNTTGSHEHYEETQNKMGNPSTDENQRQVFSARCDVRSFADAWKFLEQEWGEVPSTRSDAVDWCVEVVAQLYQEVTGASRTESFKEAYNFLEKRGVDFSSAERTQKVMQNNLKQESVKGLMSNAPSKKEEAQPAATLAEEVTRLRKKNPDWSDNEIVKQAKKNLDIPLQTEKQDNDGPIVTGSSEGLAGVPKDVDTAGSEEADNS